MAAVAYLAAMGTVLTTVPLLVAAAGASVADGAGSAVFPAAARVPGRVVPAASTAVPVLV